MKVTIKIEKEVDIKTLVVKAGVRHWEDAEINSESDTEDGDNIPCKVGDLWYPIIEIETGKIANWEIGKTAKVHYKVTDCCGWEIKDNEHNTVLSADDGYVPLCLSPNENGYGDYIKMDIDGNGMIAKWNFDIDDFIDED